jgi:NAD-dependent deacetylase
MKKLVVLSGAGVSAESGIKTFRDADGLWEGHDVMEVASPQGWRANPALVLDFYNQRRKQAQESLPNDGHLAIAQLEEYFDIHVITQNVDNLHERAGSTKVYHLHGELSKARSSVDESLIFDLDGWELKMGTLCPKGSQLRPHIVWFGEMVPMMDVAMTLTQQADIFIVVGTSLAVYPAAGLIHYVPATARKYIVDPNLPETNLIKGFHPIQEKASTGLKKIAGLLAESL